MLENEEKQEIARPTKRQPQYIALKTIKVLCNEEFQLVEGQPIPDGIEKAFITSLKNSNIIK